MKLIKRKFYRNITIGILLSLLLYTVYLRREIGKTRESSDLLKRHVEPFERYDGFFPDSGAVYGPKKIDWHNYTALKIEATRTGNGEQGQPAKMAYSDPKEKKDLWDVNGFNAQMSDAISLDRAVSDIRHEKCKSKLYNNELPTVSVVIPFFEEHWTTLLRTVVSVLNRTPPSLLKEILLVDDGSSMKKFLGADLDEWVSKHKKVKVVRLKDRVGLIAARQAGAKAATADVLVVLDSHCEVMIGWLPPLLEPIMENPRTAVCPLIDVINHEHFAYAIQDNGGRGAFDWRLYYKRLALTDSDTKNLPEPFQNPVMNGGLFAMTLKFFWELGGYDMGIKIWGGEQYNLSFKIWMCGGRLLDAPCSRVGHIFRHGGSKRPAAKGAGDFISVNYKRVAVGWMDEYIEALYRRNKHLRDVDQGDMTNELAVRKRLKCKSFKWFLETIAPDLLKEYPPVEPPDFANGTIKSDENPTICIDTASHETGPLILYGCHGLGPQYFSLSHQKTIKVESEQFCWTSGSKSRPELEHCQKDPPRHHLWKYDPVSKTIQERLSHRCVQADILKKTMSFEPCSDSISQKWTFNFVNKDLIAKEYSNF